MWIREPFFKYTTAIILILTIIALFYFTAPVFSPLLWFAAAVLLPILFSTFFYYLLRPLVYFLENWVPRYVGILFIYLIIAVLLFLTVIFIVPSLEQGVNLITNISPKEIESLKSSTSDFINEIKSRLPLAQLPTDEIFVTYWQKIYSYISTVLVNTLSTITSIAIAIALTPFVLYYFLRDDALFSKFLMRFTPIEFKEEVQKILGDLDQALSNFIVAQTTVAVVVGILLLIGYYLIGLPQPLVLALFAMIFYVIPTLGTFIAIIPALIVATTISFFMVLKVIIVMFIAHFLEADLLTPRLMAKHLKIHPLTVVFLLLAAGSVYGLLGLLLVTPTYAVLKVITWNFYKIWRLNYEVKKTLQNRAIEVTEKI